MVFINRRRVLAPVFTACVATAACLHSHPTHAQAVPTNCVAGAPGDCLYVSPATYAVADAPSPIFVSAIHRAADVPVRVVYPAGADDPRPVVVWSHGGGFTTAENSKGMEWARALARLGYVVVKISHVERAPNEAAMYCAQGVVSPNGMPTNVVNCTKFVAEVGRYDKPMDIHAVLDGLLTVEAGAQAMDLDVAFDLNRTVVAGHSGGSAATLGVAGALRRIGDDPFNFNHGAPRAFVALSPLGPDGCRSGYTSASYRNITRPVFTATGTGDSKAAVGKMWSHRIEPHRLMPAGDGKVRFFIDSVLATHGAFNLGPASPRRYHSLLKSGVAAFLDAVVNGDAMAQAYVFDGDLVGALSLDPAIPSGEIDVPHPWCWKRNAGSQCVF